MSVIHRTRQLDATWAQRESVTCQRESIHGAALGVTRLCALDSRQERREPLMKSFILDKMGGTDRFHRMMIIKPIAGISKRRLKGSHTVPARFWLAIDLFYFDMIQLTKNRWQGQNSIRVNKSNHIEWNKTPRLMAVEERSWLYFIFVGPSRDNV